MAKATNAQVRELANAIALQAQAVADGTIEEDTVYAQVALLASNVKTLQAWTAHLNPSPARPSRAPGPWSWDGAPERPEGWQ